MDQRRTIDPVCSDFTLSERVLIMKDLHADWKRWTLFERVSALGAVFILILAVPAMAAAGLLPH